MSDAMNIPRTSRRLAGMRPLIPRGSSSVGGRQGMQEVPETAKGNRSEEVYTPC